MKVVSPGRKKQSWLSSLTRSVTGTSVSVQRRIGRSNVESTVVRGVSPGPERQLDDASKNAEESVHHQPRLRPQYLNGVFKVLFPISVQPPNLSKHDIRYAKIEVCL
jgi:hypothetical protein